MEGYWQLDDDPAADPYSLDPVFDLSRFKLRMYLSFAVTDPHAQVTPPPMPISYSFVVTVGDPARRWARSWREFGRQLIDIVRHEFWCAAGEWWRSPGIERPR